MSQRGTPALELYDLKQDATQKENVAANHPDIVKKMRQIAAEARTYNPMFPLTYEEFQNAAPRKTPPKAAKKKAL